MRTGCTFSTIALMCSSAALAGPPPALEVGRDPFIFVARTDENGGTGAGLAWWLLGSTIRPTGTAVAGITLARINSELGAAADHWCHANALTANSFVSQFAPIQDQIDATMRTHGPSPFRATGAFTGGPALDAVVGDFETCDGQTGAFLLITDRTEPEHRIIYIHAFDWRGLIHVRTDGDSLVVSSCFECGHAEGLFYDRARGRFYWQSLGD
jgi:hypothetical protein